MTYILLTGAGFSRNWGGWLANEAFEYLLGAPEVDDAVRRMLWDDKLRNNGFEDTLARLQSAQSNRPDPEREKRLNALTAALVGMFNAMGLAFVRRQFEPQNDTRYLVRTFLSKFDAIFTLNQDTLLELHYLDDNIMLGSAGRWNGWQIPGMQPIRLGLPVTVDHGRIAVQVPKTSDQFRVEPSRQPYFKLHGSANWNCGIGRILIMGGDKAGSIERFPVLAWYHDRFVDYLQHSDTKLMVIGYSFGDRHINEAIRGAVDTSLKMFIIDPAGVDVLDKRDKRAAISPPVDAYMEKIMPNVIGASRRPLTAIFNNDRVEHDKIMRFFSD